MVQGDLLDEGLTLLHNGSVRRLEPLVNRVEPRLEIPVVGVPATQGQAKCEPQALPHAGAMECTPSGFGDGLSPLPSCGAPALTLSAILAHL